MRKFNGGKNMVTEFPFLVPYIRKTQSWVVSESPVKRLPNNLFFIPFPSYNATPINAMILVIKGNIISNLPIRLQYSA